MLVLSSLCANLVFAHEVQPSIANIETQSSDVTVSLRLNIEAQLAGIDLDGLADTDEVAAAPIYDGLRAQSQAALSGSVAELVSYWEEIGLLRSGSDFLDLEIEHLDIPQPENLDVPRVSVLVLNAKLPAGARSVRLMWPKGAGDLVLREQAQNDPYTGYLRGGEQSPELHFVRGAGGSGLDAFLDYIPVGFVHIVPMGLDHILFVIGLFLFSMSWRPLLMQITAFTLAHTVTLALGALGWVNLPGQVVEPLIAASIVFVALENILRKDGLKLRLAVVFGFGLLHGLGFAGVLADFGLPAAQFIPALLGFNIGVELGQLAVVAVCATLIALSATLLSTSVGHLFPAVSRIGSVGIAVVAVFWVVERLAL